MNSEFSDNESDEYGGAINIKQGNIEINNVYIYDNEGKVINPTFGAGIRLLQYGFDFGYTAGEQGHPRANTMFFSINMKL